MANLLRILDDDDPPRIQDWGDSAYRYRIITDMEQMLEIFVRLATSINYGNFKAKITDSDDQINKLTTYHHVWDMMRHTGEGQ